MVEMLTSTRPNITPAPIVPIPATKNGMDTCNVVFHHSSCLNVPVPGFTVNFSSTKSGRSPSSPPRGSSDDAIDVVVIVLNEPTEEAGGNTVYLSCSLSRRKKQKIQINTCLRVFSVFDLKF